MISLRRRLEKVEAKSRRRLREKRLRQFPTWLETELRRQDWAAGLMSGLTEVDWRYQALPAQRDFHSNLVARFKGYSGPTGSGKSFALVYEALFLSRMNPGLLGLVGAPISTSCT